MNERKITIQKSDAGKRLDKFLAEKFSDYSRSFIQKLIKENKVTVNNQKISVHYQLKEKDIIRMELKKPASISLKPESKIKLDIVFENNDFIILNKPAGLVIHPSPSTPNHTLVNGLLAYYPQMAKVGDDSLRPGIVHRLDKDVSGALVIAKNQKAFLHLKNQFQKRLIKKKYLALIRGKINPPVGEINLSIGRSKRYPFRMGVKKAGEGKTAQTIYSTQKTFLRYSLLEIRTKTGRTHQIRVHLFSLGHPIVGDSIYRQKRTKTIEDFNRIFLHAHFLQFTDLQGEKRIFQIDLPIELKQFLSKLH